MFDTSYFIQVIPKVFMKIPVTLEIAVISTAFALLIGVVVAVIAYFKNSVLYPITRALVSFTRGTPLVAQLYFLYFGAAIYSTLVRDMTPTMAVCLVLSVNVGAFMSESIRGALMSVDAGQKEAALSLGMTNFQIISRIVLPDSTINTLDDLKAKKVGVLNGQAAQKTITELGEKNGFEVIAYEGDNSVAGYQDVVLGRLDAFATTDSAVYKWENTTNNDLRLLDERLYANDVAFYFPKTEEGKALRDEVNIVLDEMMADGTVFEIITKYMYQDMTELIKPYDELGFTIE